MLKRTFVIIAAITVLLSAALSNADELNERSGIVIGIGPSVGGEVHDIKHAAGGARFRAGWGFGERFIAFLDNAVFATRKNDDLYTIYNGQLKAQFFLFKGIYADLGAGIGVGSVAENASSGSSSTTKVGFSVGGGIGCEFRPSEHFAISPEITFDYDRIKSSNYVTPAAFLDLRWYL